MEVYSSSVEDQLVDGLSFKLNPGSSYVTDRQSVSFFPSGSNVYTTTSGTKILRILINGDDWLDASNTLRVFFDVRNTGSQPLRVLGGPHCFWRRLRILAGNQLIEDIDYYARVHQMFDILRAGHVRENEDCEGFEHRYDQDMYKGIFNSNANVATAVVSPGVTMNTVGNMFVSVPAGEARAVSFKPLSGLLNCGKLIPIRYCPLTIELELVSSASDPIINHADEVLALTTNFSTSWQIESPSVKVDICVLDNALNNEYAALLLSGKALPINYSSYVTQLQSIAGQTPSINITRALSRLKSVFVTLDQALPPNNSDGTNLKAADTDLHIRVWKKWWNDFFHPMSYSNGGYSQAFELEAQLQVGSKLFPSYPIRSCQEAFYQLRKCMGVESSNFHSMDISPLEYRNHKFVLAFDTEKMLGSAFSGINIKTGSLMTLKMKSGAATDKMPDTCYLVLHFDSILSIRDSGIEVFE